MITVPETPEKTLFPGIKIGGKNQFFLIAGPCVIEEPDIMEKVAAKLQDLKKSHSITVLFKSSFDKANRSNIHSFRGPGLKTGLKILADIKKQFDLPVITDIHSPEEAEPCAEVCDMLQVPAFLSRQTDLIVAAARTGRWVNVKKGQFMAPLDAMQIVDKFTQTGSDKITICERGYTFGYNNLVVDMRSIELLRKNGVHIVIDATHSTQLPGGGIQSGGDRAMAFPIARAAVATGVEGIFMEVHPDPEKALSDATTQLPLDSLPSMIDTLLKIDALIKNRQ